MKHNYKFQFSSTPTKTSIVINVAQLQKNNIKVRDVKTDYLPAVVFHSLPFDDNSI